MKLVVIIPTLGRKELLSRALAHLEGQKQLPDEVVVSVPDASHVEGYQSDKIAITYLYGSRGLSAQRNAAINYAQSRSDIMTFFDDDFLPASDYLETLVTAFKEQSQWVVIMGHAVRDGASGSGFSFEEGWQELQEIEAAPLPPLGVEEHVGAYGCNMSVRSGCVGSLRFDERLVLYGWQEDIDFTSQLRVHGRVVSLTSLRGVHLGTKSGRVSGIRVGYSQIVNPVYLIKKGTMPYSFAFNLLIRNIAANTIKSLRPEPWVDRRGRLKGNLLGLYHVLRGRVEPEHILQL